MRLFGLGLLLSLGTSRVHADVYKCLDGQGGTHYQNSPCTGDDSRPVIRTEEQPSSTAAQPRRSSPRRAPAPAAQDFVQSEREETRRQARRDALRHVFVEEVHLEEVHKKGRRKSLILRGMVRNGGKQRVTRVSLQIEWQDNTGAVLTTSVVHYGGLEPGEAKSWSVSTSTSKSVRITQYDTHILGE